MTVITWNREYSNYRNVFYMKCSRQYSTSLVCMRFMFLHGCENVDRGLLYCDAAYLPVYHHHHHHLHIFNYVDKHDKRVAGAGSTRRDLQPLKRPKRRRFSFGSFIFRKLWNRQGSELEVWTDWFRLCKSLWIIQVSLSLAALGSCVLDVITCVFFTWSVRIKYTRTHKAGHACAFTVVLPGRVTRENKPFLSSARWKTNMSTLVHSSHVTWS
jgi:hypothetical protein